MNILWHLNENLINTFVFYQVWVQKTKECPLVVDIMGIVLGVIGAIVAIGLALILMWKVFTTIHDRREFARFEKERMLAKWDTVRIGLKDI